MLKLLEVFLYIFEIRKGKVNCKLKIKVDPRDLIKAMQDDTSVYHVICLAPIQDMYNGIILAQIKSYQVFIQKRLIDGYVSSAPTISEVEASGQEPAVTLIA